MAALCLRILQASPVYVDTLMLQAVLAAPAWAEKLTPGDRRGLTPLSHPYGDAEHAGDLLDGPLPLVVEPLGECGLVRGELRPAATNPAAGPC